MKADLIAIGGSYVVKDSFGRGRAVVTGSPSGVGRNVYVPIIFPDAKPGQHSEMRVSSREIQRVWTEADQEALNESRRKAAELDAVEVSLETAGYKPAFVRTIHGNLYIGFDGDAAERVKALCLANPYVESTRELTR